MEAGYGAEEQATRRGRKVERLRREREAAGAVDSAVEAKLEMARRQQRNWSAGAEGERMVADAITVLGWYGWTVIHDMHWPGRPRANIDHIALGPGGIIVIDAKNWSGDVTALDGVIRQNGYRRDREVEGAAQAAAAVTAILAPQHRKAVIPVICLASQDQEVLTVSPGVRVVGRLQLAASLADLPPVLSPYDVADVGRHLIRSLGTQQDGKRRGRTVRQSRGPQRSTGRRDDQPFTMRAPRPGSARTASGGRGSRQRAGRRGAVAALLRIGLVGALGLLLVTQGDQIFPAVGTWAAGMLVPSSVSEPVEP